MKKIKFVFDKEKKISRAEGIELVKKYDVKISIKLPWKRSRENYFRDRNRS